MDVRQHATRELFILLVEVTDEFICDRSMRAFARELHLKAVSKGGRYTWGGVPEASRF
jgi:hypothetical protein